MPRDEIDRAPGPTLGEILQKMNPALPRRVSHRVRPHGRSSAAWMILACASRKTDCRPAAWSASSARITPCRSIRSATQTVEVIRGPATLRYGSQAIGGVVNAGRITRVHRPDSPARHCRRKCAAPSAPSTRGREGAVLLDAGGGNLAIHADAYGRQAGDYQIPSYPYLYPELPAPPVQSLAAELGQQVRRRLQGWAASVCVRPWLYIGVAVSTFESLYRVPGQEATATNTRIDMRQSKVTSKGEFRPYSSGIEAVRFWLGSTDSRHVEIAGKASKAALTGRNSSSPAGGRGGARGTFDSVRSTCALPP